jgi:hypothetical protein
MNSWKTTLAGIGTLLAVLAHGINNYVTTGNIDIATLIAGLTAAIGLLFAKDHDVTGDGGSGSKFGL